MSSQHGDWLPPGGVIQETKAESSMSFMFYLGSHTPSLSQYPIGHMSQPYSMWEGTIQRQVPGGDGHGAILEAGYHEGKLELRNQERWPQPGLLRQELEGILEPRQLWTLR